MDHSYIEEFNVADRYLLGKLPAEERARFEEHFVDCPKCLDLLETTESFRGGLQTVAAEEAARSSVYVQAGLLAHLARLSRGRQAILLAGAVLLVALPAVLFVVETRRVRGELEQVKLASAELQRQYEVNQQSARRLAEEAQEAEWKSAEQRQRLEAELERERQERARLADEAKRPGRLYSIASVFSLNSVRSADPTQFAPVNQIFIPQSSQLIVLSPELEPDPEFQSYRAAITTADDRLIWRMDKLQLNPKGEIELGFSARLFKAGDYLLALEGINRQGRYVAIAKYPFRVMER
jgi:hypothetical protein